MSGPGDVAAANLKPSSGRRFPARQLPISLIEADPNSNLPFLTRLEK